MRNCLKDAYKISVIVPVYNKKEYLPECIESILQQTYRNLELILVDDGSTDGSDELCRRYTGQDARVRLICQENGGPTAACVTGMREAAGSHYMFLDSDDYVDNEMLEKMAESLEGIPGEIVCCNYILEKRRTTQRVIMGVDPGVYEGEALQNLKQDLLGREQRVIAMSRCMKLCEKSVFVGHEKYYDRTIRMGDDFHLIYPALLAGSRIVVMENACFYHYRYVESSIVHGYDTGMYDSVEAWYRVMQRIVEDYAVPDGAEKLRREYCYMLIYVMKNELRNPDAVFCTRIREIFRSRKVRDILQNTPLTVTTGTNRLMYLAMTHPSAVLLTVLRGMMKVHDHGGRTE